MKNCLVIGLWGKQNSPERERAIQLNKMLARVLKARYHVQHIGEVPAVGTHESILLERLINDDLVVVDLTDGNPQRYYEMAIRHVLQKPTIHLGRAGADLLREFGGMGYIEIYNDKNESRLVDAADDIEAAVNAIENKPASNKTPLSGDIFRKVLQETALKEDLTPREKKVDQYFDEANKRLSNLMGAMDSMTKTLAESLRKPLHGIEEVFRELYHLLKTAKPGGRVCFVGMTLGIGPPHRYRVPLTPQGSPAHPPAAGYESVMDALLQHNCPGLPSFNAMIEEMNENLATLLAKASEAIVVCLNHEDDDKILEGSFLNKLKKRQNYGTLDVPTVAAEVRKRHKLVERKMKEAGRGPIAYLNSIPLQLLTFEDPHSAGDSMPRKACLVFHVGTANVETRTMENGETGFYTQVESLVEMFETTAKSLWEAGVRGEETEVEAAKLSEAAATTMAVKPSGSD